MSNLALNNALQEVDKLRAELEATNNKLNYVLNCQKYHAAGMEARRKGLTESSAPFSVSKSEAQSAWRQAWLIGWKEQDEDTWLRKSNTALQSALAGLLDVKRMETAKTRRKIEPHEIELKQQAAWKKAKETMKEVNK